VTTPPERTPLDIQVTRPMLHNGPALARIARGNLVMHLPADDLPDEATLHMLLDHLPLLEEQVPR